MLTALSRNGRRVYHTGPATVKMFFIKFNEKANLDPVRFGGLKTRKIFLAWIIHKNVTKNTYLSENIKGTIEKSYGE
jgi:hypothetical protein